MTKNTKSTKTAAAKAEPELHTCACGEYNLHVEGGKHLAKYIDKGTVQVDASSETGYVFASTECTAQTASTFAPGHDARLAGLLIAAGKDGTEVTSSGGITADPVTMSYHISDLLGSKVEWALKLHAEKEGTKSAKQAIKAAKKELAAQAKSAAAKPVEATAKVGRWTYAGHLLPDGTFEYEDAKGNTKVLAEGKFHLVQAA